MSYGDAAAPGAVHNSCREPADPEEPDTLKIRLERIECFVAGEVFPEPVDIKLPGDQRAEPSASLSSTSLRATFRRRVIAAARVSRGIGRRHQHLEDAALTATDAGQENAVARCQIVGSIGTPVTPAVICSIRRELRRGADVVQRILKRSQVSIMPPSTTGQDGHGHSAA